MTRAGLQGVPEPIGAAAIGSAKPKGAGSPAAAAGSSLPGCRWCGGFPVMKCTVDTKSMSQKIAGWLMILGGAAMVLVDGQAIGGIAVCLGIYMVGGSQKVWACQRCGTTWPRVEV